MHLLRVEWIIEKSKERYRETAGGKQPLIFRRVSAKLYAKLVACNHTEKDNLKVNRYIIRERLFAIISLFLFRFFFFIIFASLFVESDFQLHHNEIY